MRKISVFLLLIVSFATFAQRKFDKDTMFLRGEYKTGNFVLPYRLLLPENYSPDKKYPLILFLHGAGERGTDNESQLIHIRKVVENEEFRQKYPCFVLAPQCPENMRWVEVDWSLPSHTIPKEPSVPLHATMLLLDSLIRVYSIDTSRLYVTGLSMGGFGTWDVIARYPHKFAAAVPICGGADLNTAKKIAHMPIWVFHGAKDRVVSVERSRKMVRELKKYGGTPLYTEYPNVGHGAWIPAYKNPKLFEWMFKQVKPNRIQD